MSTNDNDNGNNGALEMDSVMRLAVAAARDGATICERARCMGLVRILGEGAEVTAETDEERRGVRTLSLVTRQMLLHPEIDAKRPAAMEPKRAPGMDPVRIDMFVALLAELLGVRRGQVLTDELILDRARNGAIYIEEALREYEDEDTLPGVQVTVADAPQARKGN